MQEVLCVGFCEQGGEWDVEMLDEEKFSAAAGVSRPICFLCRDKCSLLTSEQYFRVQQIACLPIECVRDFAC